MLLDAALGYKGYIQGGGGRGEQSEKLIVRRNGGFPDFTPMTIHPRNTPLAKGIFLLFCIMHIEMMHTFFFKAAVFLTPIHIYHYCYSYEIN